MDKLTKMNTDIKEAVSLYSNKQTLKVLDEIEETLFRWDNDNDRLPVEISRKIKEIRTKLKL